MSWVVISFRTIDYGLVWGGFGAKVKIMRIMERNVKGVDCPICSSLSEYLHKGLDFEGHERDLISISIFCIGNGLFQQVGFIEHQG